MQIASVLSFTGGGFLVNLDGHPLPQVHVSVIDRDLAPKVQISTVRELALPDPVRELAAIAWMWPIGGGWCPTFVYEPDVLLGLVPGATPTAIEPDDPDGEPWDDDPDDIPDGDSCEVPDEESALGSTVEGEPRDIATIAALLDAAERWGVLGAEVDWAARAVEHEDARVRATLSRPGSIRETLQRSFMADRGQYWGWIVQHGLVPALVPSLGSARVESSRETTVIAFGDDRPAITLNWVTGGKEITPSMVIYEHRVAGVEFGAGMPAIEAVVSELLGAGRIESLRSWIRH